MWYQLFPEQASTLAADVDRIFMWELFLSVVFTVPVAVLIVFFATKYHRTRVAERFDEAPEGRQPGPTWLLEASWILILFVLAMGTYGWGARLFFRINAMPADAMDVYVVGKQWMWKFQHPTGQAEIDELHVPVNFPVRLTMISEDVIHSFYVPEFRVKKDVLPGMYTTAWFEATKTGEYQLFCAEYCGTDHSRMLARVVVMEPTDYQAWLSGRAVGGGTGAIPQGTAGSQAQAGEQTPATMADQGAQLFQTLGCDSCHRPDGSGSGPPFAGRWGEEVPLESGRTARMDVQYVRQSILDPMAEIHAGYPPIMPTYEGQLDESQLLLLVEYVRSLSEGQE